MNSWGNEIEEHIGHSLWGPNQASMPRKYGTLLSKANIFQQIVNKPIIQKQGSKDFLSNVHKFILYHMMKSTPFDFPQILFNCLPTKVMKDKSIAKEINHTIVLTKVFEARGVIRKFLYETPEEVQDIIYFYGCFCPNKRPSVKKIFQR